MGLIIPVIIDPGEFPAVWETISRAYRYVSVSGNPDALA